MIFLRHQADILNIVGKYRDDVRFLHLERSIKCQYALFLKHLSNIFFECRVELKKAVKQLVIPMYLACNILISRMSLSDKNTISWRHYGATWDVLENSNFNIYIKVYSLVQRDHNRTITTTSNNRRVQQYESKLYYTQHQLTASFRGDLTSLFFKAHFQE